MTIIPPKKKIMKESIIEAAYRIVQKNGIEHVNARAVAQDLSCSTQPIYSCFPTMDALRKGVFDYACQKFCLQVIQYEENPDFLSLSVKWYLNLMRNEPHLYKMLYFSSGFTASTLADMIASYASNRVILSKMQSIHGSNEDVCKHILLRIFALLHGMGALIAFNGFELGDDEIVAIVRQTAAEMARCAKNFPNGRDEYDKV